MARPLRLEFPGAVYHVMARGNAKQAIYLDDRDRVAFLEALWRICKRLDWQVWAYCLMNNHYHLLLQTAEPTLTQGMRDLNGVYAQAFNRRHGIVGHLFQGRYRSLVVDKAGYLLEVTRYIVLNPVRSGLCQLPEDWGWSSYRATLGLAGAPLRLAARAALAPFGPNLDHSRQAFAEFVRGGMVAPDPSKGRRVPAFLGDEAFIARTVKDAEPPSTEVPKAERAWKALGQYEREASSRNEAIRAAYASGNYSQADIARYFHVHYSSVSRVVGNRSFRRTAIQDLTP
jgi:REP element-mobilizing transposase RayT